MKLGLVVGHNELHQGATNYLGESEFTFGRRIATKVQLKMRDRGIEVVKVERPNLSYQEQIDVVCAILSKFQVTHTIHLHFNSFYSVARGCEGLIAQKSDAWIADYITDQLHIRFGFRERSEDGVKMVSNTHRGYDMLHKVCEIGAHPVIIEPCFGNHRTFESKFIFESEDAYVDLLCDCLRYIQETVEQIN